MSQSSASVYRPNWASLDDLPAPSPDTAYWVCRRPPAEVLGALLEEFTGVYLDHAVVAQVELPNRRTSYPLPAVIKTWPARRTDALLAVILQMELDSQPAAFITTAINDLTNPQPNKETP